MLVSPLGLFASTCCDEALGGVRAFTVFVYVFEALTAHTAKDPVAQILLARPDSVLRFCPLDDFQQGEEAMPHLKGFGHADY